MATDTNPPPSEGDDDMTELLDEYPHTRSSPVRVRTREQMTPDEINEIEQAHREAWAFKEAKA